MPGTLREMSWRLIRKERSFKNDHIMWINIWLFERVYHILPYRKKFKAMLPGIIEIDTLLDILFTVATVSSIPKQVKPSLSLP